jgi:CheY-like chemotaxis protein
MVEDLTPDLILLDLKMPGRNGHEVLAVIKADDEFRRIPVAVLTSSDQDEDVAASYAFGGNHFITKPETPEEREHSLGRLLTNMEALSRVSRGSGLLATTGVSAVDAGGVALRQFLMWAGVVGTIGFLGAFAYFMGVL